MTKRKCWATIRPFLTNKGNVKSNEISLKQVDDVINNEEKVAECFSNAYINVVENAAGKKPLSVLDKDNVTLSTTINTDLEKIQISPKYIKYYKNTLKQ